jgi:sugar phosphate isomerase/epimerase
MTMVTRRQVLAGVAAGAAVWGVGSTAGEAMRRTFFGPRARLLGLQLYTLGELPMRDLDGCLARVAAIGYREIELPNLLRKTPEDLRAAADKAGLRIASLHLSMAAGSANGTLSLESDPERIVDVLQTLGAEAAILSMFPFPPGFRPQPGEGFQAAIARSLAEAGPDHWRRTAAMLNRCGAALHARGVALGYHNHNPEFAPMPDGRTGFDILVHETDPRFVAFEVDVGWVAAAGLDPVRFVHRHAGRMRWMHVKDLKPSTHPNFALAMEPTEVGSGAIDWQNLLPAAARAGVRHFYVEQEPPFTIDRFEAVSKSFAYLNTIA